MTMIIMNKWKSKQLDFVLAYAQVDVEVNIYIPKGFKLVDGRNTRTHILKLIENNIWSQASWQNME